LFSRLILKAYDTVDWEFLGYIMGRMRFNSKWIKWIKGFFESSTISVLVNGSPTREFKPKKGLRQGDPLGLFLFLIPVEGLSGVVREAKKNVLLDGLKIGRDKIGVSVLQFPDDTIFMCKTINQNV